MYTLLNIYIYTYIYIYLNKNLDTMLDRYSYRFKRSLFITFAICLFCFSHIFKMFKASFSISVRLLRYSSSETRKGSSALPGGAEQERREQSPSGESTSSTEASIKVLLYLTAGTGTSLDPRTQGPRERGKDRGPTVVTA